MGITDRVSNTTRTAGRKAFVIVDYFFSLIVSFIGVLIVIVLVPFRLKKYAQNAKDIMVVLTPFHDTRENSRKLYSEQYYIDSYSRPHGIKTFVVCVGDARTAPERVGKTIVFIDIKLISFPKLAKFLPRSELNIRDLIALLITAFFIRRCRAKYLEVYSPIYINWRAFLLRWLLPIKLEAQVRGNLDLIHSNDEPACKNILHQFFSLMWLMRHKITAQLFYRSCDIVIGYNINNMDNALANGAHPRKTYQSRILINDTITNAPLLERSHLDLFPQNGIVLSLWARLAPGPMLIETVQYLTPLLLKNPDIQLVMIGEGPLRPHIEKHAHDYCIASQLFLPGYRPHNYIRSAAFYSDVIIVPYGGSSLVEAALLECPVVAFDIEWQHELVRDGENGWLADIHFSDDLSRCVLEALGNQEEARRRAKNLRRDALKMFNKSRILKKESRIFEMLLSSNDTQEQRN